LKISRFSIDFLISQSFLVVLLHYHML